MIDLEEIGRKYEKAKKQIQVQKVALREKIEQQIQTESVNSLKVQNHKVSQIHKNQHSIEIKLKRNNEIKTEMQKQLQLWNNMYEELNKTLKKAGDLAHYANFIENQVSQIYFEIDPSNEGQTYQSKFNDFED